MTQACNAKYNSGHGDVNVVVANQNNVSNNVSMMGPAPSDNGYRSFQGAGYAQSAPYAAPVPPQYYAPQQHLLPSDGVGKVAAGGGFCMTCGASRSSESGALLGPFCASCGAKQ